MTYTRPPTGFLLSSWARGTYCSITSGHGPLQPRIWSLPARYWSRSFQPSPTWCPRNDRTVIFSALTIRFHLQPAKATPAPRTPSRLTCRSRAFPVNPGMRHAQSPPASPPAACNERMQAPGSRPCIHLYPPSCVTEQGSSGLGNDAPRLGSGDPPKKVRAAPVRDGGRPIDYV